MLGFVWLGFNVVLKGVSLIWRWHILGRHVTIPVGKAFWDMLSHEDGGHKSS